ncbi:hypothetical protein GCM10023084_16120 [Streptomyces lacrimifluminis]
MNSSRPTYPDSRRHTVVHVSFAHNVWFLLGPCEDVCGTAVLLRHPRGVHLRFSEAFRFVTRFVYNATESTKGLGGCAARVLCPAE